MVWDLFSKGRKQVKEEPAPAKEPAAGAPKIPIEVPRAVERGASGGDSPADEASAGSAGQSPQPSRPIEAIREDVISTLRTVFDPEIPVNVYELGLVYEIDITPPGEVLIRMTLTSPACPVAGSLPPEVEHKASFIPGVTKVKVELVWDPPWSPSKMSEAARLQLNV